MKHAVVLIACVGALAACNKGPEINVKNASAGEVAEKVRQAGGSTGFVDPGKWQTKISLLDIDIPGLPAQAAQQMKQTMAKVQDNSFETCLTEADVKRPKEDFFAGKSNDCRYDHFTMSGGKIDAALKCDAKQSGTMTMAINGTYSRDAYEATMAMEMSGGPGGKGMKMKSHSESRRIGACTGDEINARKQEVGQ
jgi:hypothetical protein